MSNEKAAIFEFSAFLLNKIINSQQKRITAKMLVLARIASPSMEPVKNGDFSDKTLRNSQFAKSYG
jgi:hypothetical protein